MRWLPFLILAYVMLGLQLGLGQFVSYGGGVPNLGLIVAVFVAANAPRESGLMGALLAGVFQDLLTAQPFGLFTLTYGLVGLAVMNARQFAYGDHPLTHFSLTLAGGMVTAVVLYLHEWIRPPGGAVSGADGEGLPALGRALWPLLVSALYTAVVAVVVLRFLARLKGVFGFRVARQRW